MRLDPDQLEWIVREVVRRLQQQTLGAATPAEPTAVCTIEGRVVATAQLEGKLDGVRQVRVGARAVVTPAARDMLKDRNIELLRASA